MSTVIAVGIVVLMASSQVLPGDLSSVARRERERQAGTDSAQVYDTEDVASAPPATEVQPEDSLAAVDAETVPGTPDSAPATGEQDDPRLRTEAQWRALFTAARAEIQRAENLAGLSEREFEAINLQLLTRSDIYNRENVLQEEIQKRRAALESSRTRLDAAHTALDRLQEDLRRAGAPAGWAR